MYAKDPIKAFIRPLFLLLLALAPQPGGSSEREKDTVYVVVEGSPPTLGGRSPMILGKPASFFPCYLVRVHYTMTKVRCSAG